MPTLTMTEAQRSTLRHFHAATTTEEPELFESWLHRCAARNEPYEFGGPDVRFTVHNEDRKRIRIPDGVYVVDAAGQHYVDPDADPDPVPDPDPAVLPSDQREGLEATREDDTHPEPDLSLAEWMKGRGARYDLHGSVSLWHEPNEKYRSRPFNLWPGWYEVSEAGELWDSPRQGEAPEGAPPEDPYTDTED